MDEEDALNDDDGKNPWSLMGDNNGQFSDYFDDDVNGYFDDNVVMDEDSDAHDETDDDKKDNYDPKFTEQAVFKLEDKYDEDELLGELML